jgi:hypothetical protein
MFEIENLTPEQGLLLRCLRVDQQPEGISEKLPPEGVNWSALREEATRQGVFPLVFHRLKSLPPGTLPEAEWALYREMYLVNGQRNLRLARRLVQVLDLLKSRGIRVLPLKGPILALRAYGDLSRRQITDLDFLIQGTDVEKVYAVLGEAGFRTEPPLTPRMVGHLARTGKDFWVRDPGTQLDFHQQIPEGPPSFRLKEMLWEDLRSLEILGCRTAVLSPENGLLLLLIHGTEHGWDTLKVTADLGYFIRANPDLKWDLAIERARKLRGLRIMALGLTLAERLLGLPIPPALQEILNRVREVRELAEAILADLFTERGGTGELTVFQRSLDTWADRMKYIGYYGLAPRTGDWMALPLPAPLFPLYYLYRPFHVLAKFGPGLLRSRLKI